MWTAKPLIVPRTRPTHIMQSTPSGSGGLPSSWRSQQQENCVKFLLKVLTQQRVSLVSWRLSQVISILLHALITIFSTPGLVHSRSRFNDALCKVTWVLFKQNPQGYNLKLSLDRFLPFSADILLFLPFGVPWQVLDDVRAAVQHQHAPQLLHLGDGAPCLRHQHLWCTSLWLLEFLILKFLREAISLHLVVDIDISLWLLKFLILKFLRGHLVFVIGISDTYLYDCWYS